MNLTKKILFIACTAMVAPGGAGAFSKTNFFAPYNPNLAPYKIPHTQFRLGAQVEYGNTHNAYNWDGKKKNVLCIHGDYEDVYQMIAGANPALANAYQAPHGGPFDSTVAKVAFDAEFEQLDVTLFTEYKVPVDIFEGHTQFSMYLPIRDVKIKNVHMTPPTLQPLAQQNTVDFFNDWVSSEADLKAAIKDMLHDNSLDLNQWERTGAGDLAAILKWSRVFRQDKDIVRSVQFYFKGGVSIPTGNRHDLNKVFSIPLGNDGAIGIPLGLGLALNMKYRVQLGIDTEFFPLLDNTDDFRMKTRIEQTEFLLTEKGSATKNHGLTWKFNGYVKGVHLWKGFSVKAAYEYTKHDSDTLTPKTNTFNTSVINTAKSLQEWNSHNLLFFVNWDSFRFDKRLFTKPQVSIFFKVPVNGKNIIAPYTFGGQFAVNF